MNLIEINSISIKLKSRILFENISFSCSEGICLIKGKSGCGKSTLLDVIMGFRKADSGSVKLLGKNIYDMSLKKRRRYVFSLYSYAGQRSSLIYEYSLKKNLKILKRNKEEIEKANLLAKELNFNSFMDKDIDLMSGGERQKAEIISCLCVEKPVYVLDEPFSSIDQESRKQLKAILLNLSKNHLVIVVDHSDELEDIKPDVLILFAEEKTIIENKHIESKPSKINYCEVKQNKNPFVLFKSYLNNHKLDFTVKSLLILAIFILFGLSVSNKTTSSLNRIYSGDVLERDPFEYHRLSFNDDTNLDYSIEELNDNHMYETSSFIFSRKINDELILRYDFKKYNFLTSNETNLKDDVFYFTNTSSYLFNNSLYLNSKKIETVVMEDDQCPDYIEVRSAFDKKDDSFLVMTSNTYKQIMINGGFSTIKLNSGNLYSIMNSSVVDNNINLSLVNNFNYHNDLVIDNRDGFHIKIGNYKKGTPISISINVDNENASLSSITTTEDGDGINSMSLDTYRYISLLYSGKNMISNDFYYLLADKQTIRNIVENKKDGGISFNKDLIKFYLGEGDNKFILFSSLCGGLILILIIYLIVSNRGLKKWTNSTYDFFKYNGLDESVYFVDQITIDVIPIILSLIITTILYYSCFINLSNYFLMFSMYGNTRPESFYYYSQEPNNAYFDSIQSPLKIYGYESLFWCIIAIAIVLFIACMLLKIQRNNNKDK